ncbi:peroxiredoxin [Caldinitratiruptor microaerophilus]|uniref:Peroxiredoxin n=1 Tax=Caldinitratiruptor microaerophilus TaxID=671077 RepID=A0AA35CN04_9FIRM|nr:peroxiredoxin [Caldinitratiruptor microaerophilus]BDG61363.1 peroxiredoxin [Caldinitratiruptor microaerophilus]
MDVQPQSCVRVGAQVPDFVLPAYFPETGEQGEVRLQEYKQQGKWVVLVFYPADFTFVCPTELADYARYHSALRERGVEIIGVSTDTVFTHKAWLEAETMLRSVRYPLAADHTGAVSRMFGVYDEQSGVAMRGTFVISPEGVLQALQITAENVGRSAEETYRLIEGLQFVRNNPGVACPASWRPGEKVLKPGLDLVGNVGRTLGGD